MTMQPITIKIIVGSTREKRFSREAADWFAAVLEKHADVRGSILDLRDYPMPFFDASVGPSQKKEPYAHEAVERFTLAIGEADGFVIVTPEYNHGIPAVLKNALDWVYREWNNKPVTYVSYGSMGGARAVEQLRLNAVELQMAPIREAVHFPGAEYFPVRMGAARAADLFARYEERAELVLAQLLWWARALRAARNAA